MAKKLIRLVFTSLIIACLLSSCTTPSVPQTLSTPHTGAKEPYFIPIETKAVAVPTENRDQIYDFLEKNVLGRTLSMSSSDRRTDQGRVAVDISITKSLTNLSKTKYGLVFDEEWIIKHITYDLNPNGERTGDKRVWDRQYILRYHLKQMRSTGEVIGYANAVSLITESDLDWTNSSMAVRARLSEGKLIIESVGNSYEDAIAAGGRFKPDWSHGESVLEIKEGRLSWEDIIHDYGFNLRTRQFESSGRVSYLYREVTIQ